MNELVLYPESDEKIKIDFNILLQETKYLPAAQEINKEKELETSIVENEISDSIFEDGLSEFEKANYILAATSGAFTGILNILWNKDYDLEIAQKWGKEKVEKFVLKVASSQGFKGNDIQNAIRFLENKFPIQADKYTSDFGGGRQHHLRDFAHHPTIVGLIASILTQFGVGIGTDKNGVFKVFFAEDKELEGNTFGEKIFNGFIMWSFHLISDMAGSSSALNGGTGIPGVILSMFKEISSLPILKEIHDKYRNDEMGFSVFISKLFNGTYFKDKDGNPIRIDFRTELGVIVNQSKSVVINECIVRALYSLRSLYKELVTKKITKIEDIKKIDIKDVLPYKNKMLTRMLTISSGVFVLLDISKALVKSKGTKSNFFLNINYIGIGRFILACKDDFCYIEEDTRKILYDKYFKGGESVFKYELLNLNQHQMQLLYSLELELIKYDLIKIKDRKEKEQKKKWCEKWKETISTNLSNGEGFITDSNKLFDQINKELKNNDKFYVLALELFLFRPYYSIDDIEVKKFRLSSNYYKDVFEVNQKCLEKNELKKLIKIYNNYNKDVLQNKKKKIIIGASATATITVLSGGLGWYFAPQIAAVIAGESVAGLSGAALTSASLAFVGGGSLAAGGLGMAGGTAILAGGGALIGLAGSSATTMTAIINSTSSISILEECSKLLTISKIVIVDKLKDYTSIESLKNTIDGLIVKLSKKLDEIEDKKNSKSMKNIKKSIKYLNRCSKALEIIINDNKE